MPKNIQSKIVEGRRYFSQTSLSPRKLRFIKKYIIALFVTLGFLFLVSYITNKFFISCYLVSSDSMYPTLKKGDTILIYKNYEKILPGDIVVFKYEDKFFIKRVIGLPGEKVSFDGVNIFTDYCVLKIFNQKLKANKNLNTLEETIYCKTFDINTSYSIIPGDFGSFYQYSDGYFVLGDNRQDSVDSRVIGPIKEKSIIGKVFYKF